MNKDVLKIRTVALAIIIAVLVLVSTAYSFQTIRGDVDKDGRITLSDVTKLFSFILNNEASVDASSADFNNDGHISLADGLALIKRIVNGYTRTDFSGDMINASVSMGVSADLSDYTSLNGVALAGTNVYVSDETGRKIYKLSDGGIEKTYSSTTSVNAVVASGNHVYSLEGDINGRVIKLTEDLVPVSSVDVGHTPSDMATVGSKGYTVNRFSNTVSVIDLETMSVTKTLEIEGREPIAAATNGSEVYVACHLPDKTANEDTVSANVVIISTENDSVSKVIPLVNGASGVKDVCVSPDGKTVYVSHVIGRYAYPTTQLDRGWINTNGFSVISTSSKTLEYTCLLDEVDCGAANPWGITVSEDGKTLCVAISGLDEIMLVDIAAMQKKEGTFEKEKIVNHLPFLDGCRKRISVGKGVRAIAEKDGVLYCATYFDGTLEKINLADRTVSRLEFKDQPKANEVRMGQILWSDANNCYQKWQSCNSCHPDAIVDGFNWDNLNDGLGNGKSAKSMLYSHRTPPVMITGIRESAEVAVAAGMKFIQFNTLGEKELSYIDEYLKSLSPIPSPALTRDKTLTESAKSGESLFEANCAACHPAPLYTDLKKHNVNTAKLEREDGYFDTPTLVEVWRTAPYLHDGSLGTVEEVVRHFAPKLTETEVRNLADYVRSIGNEGEYYGIEQIGGTLDGVSSYNTYIGGLELRSVSVRYQNLCSAKEVVAVLNVYGSDGKQVYYCDVELPAMEVASCAVISLDGGIVLPEGGYLTAEIFDVEEGKALSSKLTIK